MTLDLISPGLSSTAKDPDSFLMPQALSSTLFALWLLCVAASLL